MPLSNPIPKPLIGCPIIEISGDPNGGNSFGGFIGGIGGIGTFGFVFGGGGNGVFGFVLVVVPLSSNEPTAKPSSINICGIIYQMVYLLIVIQLFI